MSEYPVGDFSPTRGPYNSPDISEWSNAVPAGSADPKLSHPFKVTYSNDKISVGAGVYNGSTIGPTNFTVSSSGGITISAGGTIELGGAGLPVATFIVTGSGTSARVTRVTQQLFSDVAYQLYGGADGGNDFTQIIRGASFMDATAGRGYAASMRGFEVTDADGNGALVSAKKIQLITAAGKLATLDIVSLTKDMTLQEMTVLVAGSKTGDTVTLTKKKVLALISTPEADTDDSFDVAGDYTGGSAISIVDNVINVRMDGIIQTADQASTSAIAVDFLSVGEGEVRILLDLKPGAAAGDLLQWDGTGWVPLSLGADSGPLFWDGTSIAASPASPAGIYYSDGTDWGTIPFGPEDWTVYDEGVVTTRKFLTDNPDPV